MVIIYCSLFSIVSLFFGTDFIYPFFFFEGRFYLSFYYLCLSSCIIIIMAVLQIGHVNIQWPSISFVFQIQTNAKPSARIFLLEILL